MKFSRWLNNKSYLFLTSKDRLRQSQCFPSVEQKGGMEVRKRGKVNIRLSNLAHGARCAPEAFPHIMKQSPLFGLSSVDLRSCFVLVLGATEVREEPLNQPLHWRTSPDFLAEAQQHLLLRAGPSDEI